MTSVSSKASSPDTMGNIPSHSGADDAGAIIPRRNTGSGNEYMGKLYEPSRHQVDCMYADVVGSYLSNVDRWYGVDEELLLLKLRSEIREKNPALFLLLGRILSSTADDVVEEDGEGTIESSKKKKQKVKDITGPIRLHGLRVPREVVAHFLPYCDRLSINNFSQTCSTLHQAINKDRRVVKSLPWPVNCRWPRLRWGEHSWEWFVASRDASFFAIMRIHSGYAHTEIWDRFHGLIGELACRSPDNPNLSFKPVFSPDCKLLISPLTKDVNGRRNWWRSKGVHAVQLPLTAERAPVIVSEHSFRGGMIHSLVFVNNDTVAVVETALAFNGQEWEEWEDIHGIDLYSIDRTGGDNISFTLTHTILQNLLADAIADSVAAYTRGTKTFLAISKNCREDCITFHDLTNNETISKDLEGERYIVDMAFAKNGKLVVTYSHDDGIYVYDCQVDSIGEIGEPKQICCSTDCSESQIYAFSADGTKVLVGSDIISHSLIDLQKEEEMSEHFLDEDEAWDLSTWNAFAN